MNYRTDIDGLRAIAVILVLAYHLKIPPISGGFVGVDVFFVISGYLMAQKIISDLATNNFKYRSYIAGRIFRLLPAATAVSFVSCIFAIAMFAPTEVGNVLQSALFSSFGLSNFWFWANSGYFGAAAITKPLLHTWSLAVEFQFYAIFPIGLIVFLKYVPRDYRRLVGFGLLLIGAVLSIIWLKHDPSGAYLLAPARFFEFGVGAAISQMFTKEGSKHFSLVCLGTGLGIILACAIWFSDITPFPGIAALLPVSGAALAIYAGRCASAQKILAFPCLTAVGKISYSIYLVHWPLIVFATYLCGDMGARENMLLIVATFGLAYILNRYIEQPFRKVYYRPALRTPLISSFAAIISVLSVLLAVGNEAWSWRFPPDLVAFIDPAAIAPARKATWAMLRSGNKPFSDTTAAKILVIGDSQAGDFTNVLDSAYGRSVEIRSIPSQTECQILASPAYYDTQPLRARKCLSNNRVYLSDPRLPEADTVIINFNWKPEAIAYLPADITALKDRGAKRIYIIGSKEIDTDPLNLAVARKTLDGLGEEILRRVPPEVFRTNAEISRSAQRYEFLDLLNIVCRSGRRCDIITPEGKPIYYDHVHFTPAGASFIGNLPAIKQMKLDQKYRASKCTPPSTQNCGTSSLG